MTPVPPDTVPPVSELLTRAERWVLDRPGAVACQVGGRRPEAVSYAETARAVRETTAALAHAGVRHGTRTVVLVFPGVELGVLALSLLRLGAVPVMVDPGLPYAAVRRCLDRAAPEVFIGVPRAQLARLALGWGRRSSRVTITVGPRRLWPGRTLASLRSAANRQPSHPQETTAANPPPSASSAPPSAGSAPHSAGSALSGEVVRGRRPAPDDLALIAYTSGSTGPPKGVPLRHRQLTAQLDLLSGLEAVRPGTPVLSTFIPFALGAAALGATAVLPDLDPRRPIRASPAALVADVQRYGVTSVFAAPALLDRLARHCVARGVVLGTVESVLVAGAPLPLPTLQRVRACLPAGARVLSVYGATECLPVAAIEGRGLAAGHTASPGTGTCLGLPVPGAEVRVIGVTDGPIGRWSDDLPVPPGVVGEIVVASPAVSDPYLDDPEATALARIHDGDRVWHRMGDLGHLDEQGRLWFAGRKSERVRTRDGDLCTDHVESLLAGLPGVRRTALVGVGPVGAQRPVLVVEREPGARRARVRAAVLEAAGTDLRAVLFHRGFPVDARHNSKIRRGVLAAWAARRLRGGWR
ncbi:fatty acid CoA ligase family protein [Nonomuraea glycinis]|uniref:fatty acid CoA ligase family protein n=1 Tax=Nonomuraea glycinis TaxID=2047744 RepID=UPI002E1037F7|nr:fatty acid CoA ligase family protein [Nonomuraea glycinis]